MNNLETPKISDLCIYDAKARGDEFVGLKYENKKLTIQFPYGYRKAKTEKSTRKDILNLISIISKFSTHKDSFFPKNKINNKQKAFPINSYIQVISSFLNYGYYRESSIIYKNGIGGKVSWNKTIKAIRPELINEKAYYFEFITRNKNYVSTELITKIHEYIVYESFEKIGFIFCKYTPKKPSISFNAKLFTRIIKSKMSDTYNERSLILFKNMLDIVDYLGNIGNDTYYYGVKDFNHIWESLIDSTYGIVDKEKYFPKCYWKIDNKVINYNDKEFKHANLRPDTIIVKDANTNNQKIYIIDAKNYQFGIINSKYNLPKSDSITKQLAYGDYIYNNEISSRFKPKSKAIYNAFILPYNSGLDSIRKLPNVFGYASSDYIQADEIDERKYYKIWGVLVDIKNLMHNHEPKDIVTITELTKAIEAADEKHISIH